MPKLRKNNPGLRFLIDLWSRHCPLEPWHVEWARSHVQVSALSRGDELYLEGERQQQVYLVTQGMLGRVLYRLPPEDDDRPMKRHILSVALPGMALMTTHHLYTDSPSRGDIVSLRSHTRVIQIPYRSILDFKEQEPHIDTLIDILSNKKRKQLSKLREISAGVPPFERYLHFAEEMPELHEVLTQKEIAELLGISKTTIQSAHHYRITGKHRKKSSNS